MTTRKTYPVVSFKTLPDEDGVTGRFQARVSVFNNIDLVGDKVLPEAFDVSLKSWQDSGDPIPVIWSHDWGNPFAHIGTVDPKDAVATDEGLEVTGTIDLSNPFAKQVYALMKRRAVKEFSFAYDIVEERTGRDKSNELVQLNLIEVGPTLKGANPDTELLGVKAALEAAAAEEKAADDGPEEPEEKALGTVYVDIVPRIKELGEDELEELVKAVVAAKAGRVLSAKNEAKIKAAADAVVAAAESLRDVLESVQAEPTVEPKAADEPELDDHDPAKWKAILQG